MKRWKVLSIVIAIIAIVIGGAYWLYLTSIPPLRVKPEVIRLGLPSPYEPAYGLSTVYAEKLLEKEGIKLTKTKFKGFPGSISALVAGEVDFAYLDPSAIAVAREKGIPLKYIVSYQTTNGFAVVARTDVVPTLKDAKGKVVGSHAPLSITDFTIAMVFEELAGLKHGVDYTIKWIPGTPARVAAIREGTIDVTGLLAEYAYTLEEEMPGKVKVLAVGWDVYPHMFTAGWATLERTIKEKPELVRYFVKYMLLAYRDLSKMSPKELAKLAKANPEWKELPLSALEKVYSKYLEYGMWDVNGDLTLEDWSLALRANMKYGLIGHVVDYKDVVDRSILDDVLREIGRA